MVDTSVLGTDAFGCESSSLSYPTREAGEFAEAYELGLNTATQLLSVKDANNN